MQKTMSVLVALALCSAAATAQNAPVRITDQREVSPKATGKAPTGPITPPSPGAVPVYRGEALIGWVTPDVKRAEASAPDKSVSSTPPKSAGKAKAGANKAGRSAAPKADRRERGTVSRIKEDFRKSVRKRFYQKPSWSKHRSTSDFRDSARPRGQ